MASTNASLFDHLDDETRERMSKALGVLLQVDEEVEKGTVVSCRECSATLPSDEPCEHSEDQQHDPDQTVWEPESSEPQFRQINLALGIQVPNDGYDYATDVTGRLEQLLSLLNLHPLVSASYTRGPTGSGYDGESDNPWPTTSGTE